MTIDQAVGMNIKQQRRQRQWRQSDLAARIGYTTSAIHHFESGQRRVSIDTLYQIAAALNIRPQELLP